MRFGESNGAFETHEGDGGSGWECQGKAFWADFGQQNIAAATDWRHQVLQ
jgi:hypothetical protein